MRLTKNEEFFKNYHYSMFGLNLSAINLTKIAGINFNFMIPPSRDRNINEKF